MTKVSCGRAARGLFIDNFLRGGFAGFGWSQAGQEWSRAFVQVKRFMLGAVNANVVKQLRQAIAIGDPGALITTIEYQSAAADVALEAGFPRIGLINGRQLVDLLIEHWGDIPPEFQERLGLKPGLVRT